MPDQHFTLRLNAEHAKSVLKKLIILEVCLVVLYIIDHIFLSFGRTHLIVDLDAELTFPSWFSTVQLFFIGILLFTHHFKVPQLKHISLPFISLVATGFMFLSLDETILFHERFPFGLVPIEWLPRFKNNYGAWIPVYVTMTAAFLIIFRQKIVDLWEHYRKELIIFSLGFMLFFLGGVVLEIISIENLFVNRRSNLYFLEVAMEEGLEMMGASIMLYAAFLLALH